MSNRYICMLLVTFGLLSHSVVTGQDNHISKTAQLHSLPDNPCEAISAERVSAITGVEVISVERVPGLGQILDAEKEGREPDPATICTYETRSDFGAIMTAVPIRANRRAAVYWKSRAKYFETYPGSGQAVADLGMDAWLAGGATLHVLVVEDEYFTVSTQMYQPGSRELLVKIARDVLSQLKSRNTERE